MRLKSLASSAVVFWLFAAVQSVVAAPRIATCDLPKDLQNDIATQFPGGRIVNVSDLGEDDKKLFQKDHGDACPGLLKVDFYGKGEPTLAIVLTVGSGTTQKALLIVAREIRQKWETTLLEKAESSVPVVWSQGPGEYEDVYGEKKIRATRPVIVFCGYNAWAVLYAWTGKNVDKIWLED